MEPNLEQCVTYFTSGSWAEWLSGGAIVVVTLLGALTKWNIPSSIKNLILKLAKKK